MAEDKRRLLYDQLTKDNYDLGDFQSFSENLNDSVKRRSLYDAITKDNYDVGDYESFSKALDNVRTEPARQNQTANKPEVDVSSGVQQSNTNDFLDRLREINSNGNLGIPIVPQVGQSRNGDELLSNIQGNVDEFEKGLYDRIEEERNIDKTFKPSPVNNQGDIYRNYASRFSNTERGKQLDDELASIQQEVSRKYADQYLQSPEYRQLASQYSGDELDKRANEQFDALYGKRIQDDIEPYQRAYSNEVMSRYGSNIEKESNELVKKQVGNQLNELSGKIENQLEVVHSRLRNRGGQGGNAANALMGSAAYNMESAAGRKELSELESAKRIIEGSRKIIDEASKKGNTSFVAGLGRGIRDSFNADNWSFGLTELAKNVNLNQVLDKADKGEKLSESEQALLDALVTDMAVNAYYSSDLGRGYKAGQTTGASIPFMLEFAVNPVSASGSGIAKGILRYGARRFGLASVRGAARKAALTGARLAGDAAAAAAMTGTTGLAGVASDTQERMRGDVNIDFDENGNAVYKNRENRKGFAESAFKSATSRFLENQSEMVFNAFPGIGEAIGKAIPGGMPDMLKRFGNTRMGQSVRDLYREMKSNPTLREIAQRTQFHGLGEEYMEEVYNNFASIPLGDMTFEDAVSLDNNIDTFLGLAPTSVAFGMLGLAGMARERYNHRRNMRRVFGKFTPEQQRMFNELQQMSRENGNEDIKNFIKMTIEDPGLTQEQKRDEIQYAWEIARSNAIDDIQEEETQEQVDAENADIDAHTDPKTGMYTEMDRIVINDVGEEVRVSGHKTGDIGGVPVWVEEGKEVTPENSIVLKPGQWDEGTVRSMPADEVKAENEAMIREEAAAQAEQESTYSPDIPPLQLGSAFTDGNDTYEVVQQNADGGWIAKKTSVDEKGNQKEEVVPIDEKTYMDIMQANIDAEEEAREQANRPKSEITLNQDVINSATPKDYMKANPSIVEGYITSHPEEVQIRLNDEVRKTADYLNGKTDEKGYLSSMGYLDSYLNNASDEEIRELAKEQSDRYRPYLNINNQNQQSDDNAINLSENNAKNEASSSAGQSNVSESPVQVQQSEVQPEPIQQPQGQQEEQPKTEVQDTVIPTDKEGNPLYYRAPVEVTARSISGEGLEPEEVDAFIEANQKEADKNLKKIQDKAPKMGTSIAAYKKAKAEWQEKVADAQAQSDYWKQVKEEITSIRTRPGDTTAEEIMRLGEPLNGEELAAMMLGNGSLPLLRESYMKELGAGNKEAQGMFGLFASKENGGMTIEEAGEKLMEADRENGTHFFDQNDPNAGRNAIIDVLSSARTKGDLARFIQNNRERMAEQERQAEYAAYEDWCESYMNMTVPEYETYQDYLLENNPYDGVDAAELDRIFAEAEQEYQIYLNESENGQGTTERGSGGLRGTPERDEQGGEAGVREEGVPVLSGEQPVLQGQVQGRAGGTEERPVETDDVIRDADGNVSENEEGSIDNAIEQQDGENLLDFAGRVVKNKEIDDARRQVESNPTDAQKEAGNYKKGHIKLDGYDITIENPKGSVRSGVDENGQPWSVTMNNDYGYIRGTEGVDGDHIDVFLSDSPTLGDVYVIDQVDPDTGEFDEHKVMYGFKSALAAKRAYLANYSTDWKGLGAITKVSKEEFKKWVESSHRKTKPFAEYKSVNKENVTNESNVPEVGFEITPAQYTTKRGKVLDMFLVKFAESLTKEQQRAAKELARAERGWYDRNKDGFMMRSEESAQKLANTVMGDEETVNDAQPLSLADMQQGSEPAMRQVDVEGLMQAINRDGEAKLSDHFVVGRPGLTEKATSRQSNSTTQETEQQPAQEENQYGASNKLVSRDRYEELKKRMRQKLGGQLNMGIDPEILAIGTEMAAYHIEAGARKFADYATHMIADLGDAIRPYLKSFYNGVRDLPEVQEAGYVDEMTPYNEVRTFDVATFDKAQGNAMATAEMVVAEQEVNRQADAAKEQLTNQRNEQRRQEDEQRTADTEAVANEAETTASEAESRIETATDEKEVNETVRKVDEQLDKVNRQLALLGYYEAEPVESDFNEAYGYMRNAEKKAVKDANNLAKRLVNDLGIDPKTIVDKKGKRRRIFATANIAPIGGDISIHLPLGEKRELYISIQLDNQDGDNLKVTGGMLRIENPNPERGEERYLSSNNFFAEDETYPSLLGIAQRLVKHYAPDFVPVNNTQQGTSTKSEKKQEEPKIADLFSAQEENAVENQENSPFKKGDAVVYKGKPATVYDIEDNGRLVLDTGLAPVLYESADPKEVKPANTATHNAGNTEINRIFANAVKTDMLAALDSGTKPYRSILDLRKRAAALGMEVDNDGRTDILLQELVEDGLVRAAREVVEQHGRDSRESYDLICKLYEMQPTIAARSSNRIKMQQYSTPLPMAWNATRFAMSGKKGGKVLEPTAGNGMLVFAVPANQVHVNELDETRLDNLREQGFAQVTQQDATEPFEGGQQYDVIIANPPFGKSDEVEYDGKMISGLDPQITLNALASMKDDGRAAIIIGGNMEYASNGGLKSMKPFFTYLYDHYNVKGVVDMDGSLYAKQGTTYPTRMILIDGRRSEEERAQSAVYPPVQSKAIRKADSFETLYDIIDEVINSNEKTNGTEILRSQQGQLISVADQPSRNADGKRHTEQPRKDDTGRPGGRTSVEGTQEQGEVVLRREHRTDTGNGEARRGAGGNTEGGSRRVSEPDAQRVERVGVSTERVGLEPQRTAEQPKKRGLSEEKLPYRPHNSAFSLQSVAPAAMVEAMDRTLSQIEKKHGNIDEFVRKELGYDTTDELHQALAAEQIDSVAMAIYQMKQGQALIIGDQTGVGKGRQMAALIRWAVRQGEKPIFITQKADLFSDIYRDLVDIGSGDLVPFIFNSPSAKENKGEMVDANGKVVYKGLSDAKMKKVLATGKLPDECDYAVLTYSQVNTGDEVSQKEMEEAAKKNKTRSKKSKSAKDGKATPKATFLRSIAEDNYLFLDESHTAAGSSNTGAYLQSILRSAKAATFASATFAKRPDTMPLYAIRTAMSQAKVEPDKLISIIEKGGVTLQEIMSRELTNAGQMVRRERDMSDVVTDWKTINDPETVRRARENYDRTIAAFNAIIKFQEDYVKPMVDAMDKELAVMAESAGIKRGTDKLGVENVPFASKTYNYTKQLMLALKVDAIANEVDAEIKAGRHPVIALESTMESSIKDYSAGEVIAEPTFSASLLRGLDTVMQYTIKDENGKEQHARYSPKQLGSAGEKAYYELQDFIRESTSDIFISPLDAIIERLHDMGYKVGELTGRNMYVERDNEGRVIVKRRTDKDKKRMQREFNNGELDVLILNKSASTGISLHASEKFSDQRQRTMIIAQPLSDINDYMQMIGRIDRTGQVHRGYYINLGLPVPAENRFLMMLSTKLKSLNANTTTSQDSESNEVEAPDLLNKYGSQVVVEYLRDNPDIYEKMGSPLKKGGENGGRVQTGELDEYKPQEDDARKITGYVALLTTQEQEEFYDDVVRRYNELIKYLNDTGNNDLKITVMPLRAKTLSKRVSSEGMDPTGTNPFARNSYVERVEMDVLRKPMKAAEIRKAIEQVNKGKSPEDYVRQLIATIEKEDEVRIAAEEARYERSKVKAQEDISKQTEKINSQQKRTAEEKQAAIADYARETNENVETKHKDNMLRLNTNSDMLKQRLHMFEVGKSYLMPDNLESMVFDFSTPAIFCGYKAKDSKITASTTLAVFATLDGRRRMEIKLSQPEALRSIYKTTNDNWDAARSTTLENWDSQIPTGTRKTGFIMTGNILQAIADTQDEHGGYPGQLISYTDIDGNVHDGILMPDKWNTSMLKTSGAPIINRLKQIKDYMPVTSHDGKVDITGSSWAKMYYLTVPKTKKDGSVYYENKTILDAVHGHNFYPFRGKLRADITEENIESVVRELSKLGVKVKEETNEDDALYRNGEGTLTDDELSYENDPVAKMTGRSTRTTAQRRAFAERERQRMVNAVQKLAETLHLDNVDIVTDASTLQGRRAKAKGFYSRGTGRITIVIPNHTSVYDVEQTLLHEAVAHYGLRQLFGEHFDTFLDNVYRNAEPEVRKKIVELAQKKGWNIATATEEYLASLAEDTNFDDISASWWSKIKELFLRMLHEIGFENFSGVTLSDNELRYILWRSYENLAEPGRYRSILGGAADIVKQNELKVGNYAEGAPTEQNAAESGDDLYRMAPDGETDDGSREAYNRAMTGNRFKAQEAYQDSMLSLKRLQEVVEKYSGKKLQSFEDAYMAENQMSSKNTREKEVYGEKFFKPMIKSVGELMKKGASYGGIIDYMIAKHGLERNEAFAYRDAELQTERRFSDKYKELEKMNDSGLLTDEEYQNRKDKLDSDKESYYQERVEKNLEKDYSGLTALADKYGVDEEEFKKHAEDVVADFESRFDASDLWGKVNSATKETLRKAYESGMMGRDTYNKVRGQFKYYIPLRGWDETTAEDVYEYLNSETSPVNSVLKSAKGRKSLADDPFATIGNMGESTIHQGNRNLMKQNFLNMAINHPTDVLTVKEAWYVKDTETGDWKMSFPDIKAGDSADVIADKIEEHEQRMKELENNGEATKVKEGLNIDYRIGARQAREHIVTIKRNGKDYLVFVNGNPRAAQAVNGLTNPDADENKLLAGISRLNRELAANFTNRNPAFVLSNLARDLIFSVSAVSIKESPEYSRKFAKNIIRSMRVIARNLRGKGDPQHNQDDALFEEFLANGGETGYTMMHSVDEYKKMVKRELGKKEITGKTDYFSAVRACAQFFSTMNRWAEDVSRFTAYMTSKESGRPVMQSVNDAKEITVNFNRRGAGSKTSGVFGWTSGMFRNLYLFFNAGIQSLSNFGRLAKKNPKAFTTALAGFTASGFIVPVLNGLFISLLGDGDDDYYGNLPDWVRKNNLCLFIPGTKGKFITIPLPIELRAFYGLGEMAYQETIGKEGSSGGQIAYKAINQITELLPLNPLGNNGDIAATIIPDVLSPIWQAYDNKDFTGKPVYRKNAFNENMPEWTKAYNSTDDWLVDLSEWTNEIAGGDKYKRGELLMSNWNPAIVEHLFESYFGGMAKTFNQTAKTLVGGVESAVKGEWSDELQWYSTPVLNRFINDASDDRSSFGKVNQRYYKLYEQYEETGKLIRGYSNEVSKGNLDYLDKLNGLYRSDDYKTYLVFKRGKRLVDRIREMEKSLPEGDSKERKALQEQSVKIKRSLIDAVEDVAGD